MYVDPVAWKVGHAEHLEICIREVDALASKARIEREHGVGATITPLYLPCVREQRDALLAAAKAGVQALDPMGYTFTPRDARKMLSDAIAACGEGGGNGA